MPSSSIAPSISTRRPRGDSSYTFSFDPTTVADLATDGGLERGKPLTVYGAGKANEKGVCLSKCLEIPFEDLMSQSTCDDAHVCVPCVHPLTKQPTGAPGC